MPSIFIVGALHTAANNINMASVARGTQQWVSFELMFSNKTFGNAVNNVNVLRSSRKVPDIVVRF
jgi:hypothetical protein